MKTTFTTSTRKERRKKMYVTQKYIVKNNFLALLDEAVLSGRSLKYRIPYRTAAHQYRTVPSRPTYFFPLPYRTGTVRYGIDTAYRQSLLRYFRIYFSWIINRKSYEENSDILFTNSFIYQNYLSKITMNVFMVFFCICHQTLFMTKR